MEDLIIKYQKTKSVSTYNRIYKKLYPYLINKLNLKDYPIDNSKFFHDAVQETLMIIYLTPEKYNAECKCFFRWVETVNINNLNGLLRKNQRSLKNMKLVDFSLIDENKLITELDDDLEDVLIECINKLPKELKEIIELNMDEDLNFISNKLNISYRTVQRKREKAHKLLKEIMQKELNEEL